MFWIWVLLRTLGSWSSFSSFTLSVHEVLSCWYMLIFIIKLIIETITSSWLTFEKVVEFIFQIFVCFLELNIKWFLNLIFRIFCDCWGLFDWTEIDHFRARWLWNWRLITFLLWFDEFNLSYLRLEWRYFAVFDLDFRLSWCLVLLFVFLFPRCWMCTSYCFCLLLLLGAHDHIFFVWSFFGLVDWFWISRWKLGHKLLRHRESRLAILGKVLDFAFQFFDLLLEIRVLENINQMLHRQYIIIHLSYWL